MSTPVSARGLLGRRSECAALDQLVASVRAGESRALVVHGEAGVGKSALLAYLEQHASGCAVGRAAGIEPEMELAYAGLQQLCAPFLERVEHLPVPQRDALGTAFGLRDGVAPDRFRVGLAVLSLLSEVAGEQPLMWIVDDAQWLDAASAHALAFVARRLGAESVGLVFALRERIEERYFEGLPGLAVGGLDDRDARELLATVLMGPLDERVRDRIVAETRGNPLALLELPRSWTPAELAGGFGLSHSRPLSGRIEQSLIEGLTPLPPSTRLLLLLAAAEPVGDPVWIWRAATELGIGPDAASPATAAGLVDFGAQVRFGHPLVRSAVKVAASPEERQRVHGTLARATDADIDPDRYAWHLAHSTAGLDEDVAAELERSAGRARARGGVRPGRRFTSGRSSSPPIRGAALSGRFSPQTASTRPATATPRYDCSPSPGRDPWTSSSKPALSSCTRRLRSQGRAAARLLRSCSSRRGGSKRSIRRSHARPTSRRSRLRSPPTAWFAVATPPRSPQPSWRPTGSPPRARAICSSTRSPSSPARGTWQGPRR